MRQAGNVGELVGIDISGLEVARARNAGSNVDIEEVDARECAARFGEGSFDVVIDKSTVDAMLCDPRDGLANVRRMCEQVGELVVCGGIYCVVSHNYPEEDGVA